MGKASREKEKRREAVRNSPLARALAPFTSVGAIQLVWAAANSPTCIHRLPSLELVYQEAIKRPPAGDVVPDERALTPLLEAATATSQRLLFLEDYVPFDAHERVAFRFGSRLWEIGPTDLERPITSLRRALAVSETTDPELIRFLGFGIRDLVAVLLKWSDLVTSALRPHWLRVQVEPGGPAYLSRGELAATRSVVEGAKLILSDSEQRGLDYLTVTSSRFELGADPRTASFGSTFAARMADGQTRLLPPALMFGALDASVLEFAAVAARRSPLVEDHFRAETANRVGRLLERLPMVHIPGAHPMGATTPLFDLGHEGTRRFLAVNVVASLTLAAGLEARLVGASAGLEATRAGVSFGGTPELRIPADAEVSRMLVVAVPAHAVFPGHRDVLVLRLDELEWILKTAERPDDLLFFCSDVCTRPGGFQLLTMETFDAWEHWRVNRSFHEAGIAPTAIIHQPHMSDREWSLEASRYDAERLLVDLALPGLQSWDYVEFQDGQLEIASERPLSSWSIVGGPLPLGVGMHAADFRPHERARVHSLCVSLAWSVGRLKPALSELGEKMYPLRLRFSARGPAAESSPLRVTEADQEGTVQVALDRRLWDLEIETPGQIQALLGDVLFDALRAPPNALSEASLKVLAARWKALPRSYNLTVSSVPQQATALGSFRLPNEAVAASARQRLGAALLKDGVRPGSFPEQEASELENKRISPILKGMLDDGLKGLGQDALLMHAAAALERAASTRTTSATRLRSDMKVMELDYDPEHALIEIDAIGGRAFRTIATIMEMVIASPLGGTRAPEGAEWERIFALADLWVDSAWRSEQIWYGLAPTETVVSDSFEISSRECGPPMVDMAAWREAHASYGLQSWRPQLDSDERKWMDQIDASMREEYGTSLATILGCLEVFMRWPVTNDHPVGRVTVEALQNQCSEMLTSSVAEIRAAIAILTIDRKKLSETKFEPWEARKRGARLMTGPIVAMESGDVLVLPWWAGVSRASVFALPQRRALALARPTHCAEGHAIPRRLPSRAQRSS